MKLLFIFIFRRAKSYMETEQFDEAVRDYEKVHKGDRGNQEYRYLTFIHSSATH